jgi:hypothetical protein
MINSIGNMFDQPEQQGWFGTKWPLWVFVVVWLFGDIPFKMFGYFIRDTLGWGWTGEIIVFAVIGVVGVTLALRYNARKERLRRSN